MTDRFEGRLSMKHISEIYVNSPEIIKIEKVAEPYSLRVTAMDANHCPGSVMFLFEKLGADGEVVLRILYTGDFRFEDEKSFRTCTRSLHSDKKPLVLDEMYLDTTFLSQDYPTFPSRAEATEKVFELCSKWIGKNRVPTRGVNKGVMDDRFSVLLHMPARLENISSV